jgi:hypothetical protein
MSWDYKRVRFPILELPREDFETRLNKLGSEGWELVTTVVHEHHGYSSEVHFVFKRPRTEAA